MVREIAWEGDVPPPVCSVQAKEYFRALLQCHRLKEYIFRFFAFWLISCEP